MQDVIARKIEELAELDPDTSGGFDDRSEGGVVLNNTKVRASRTFDAKILGQKYTLTIERRVSRGGLLGFNVTDIQKYSYEMLANTESVVSGTIAANEYHGNLQKVADDIREAVLMGHGEYITDRNLTAGNITAQVAEDMFGGDLE